LNNFKTRPYFSSWRADARTATIGFALRLARGHFEQRGVVEDQ